MVVELGAALLQEHGAHQQKQDADGHVDEEDPGPAERAGEGSAQEHACRSAAPRGRTPDSEGDVAVASLLEIRCRGNTLTAHTFTPRIVDSLHGLSHL